MKIIRSVLDRFPRAKRIAKDAYHLLHGLPPISREGLTAEALAARVGRSRPTVLEIGCNDGTTTRWLASALDRPRIYCFEPDPRAAARFRSMQGDLPDVTLFEIAISDRDGTATFHQSGTGDARALERQHASELLAAMPEGWDQSGSLRRPKEHLDAHPGISFDRTLTVPIRALDSWCREYGVGEIDFVWMDVQGAEIDVLHGGEQAFAGTRWVYTEYSRRELYEGQYTLRRLLRALPDFEVAALYDQDVLLRNRRLAPPGAAR